VPCGNDGNWGQTTRFVEGFTLRSRTIRVVENVWTDKSPMGLELRDSGCVSSWETCITLYDIVLHCIELHSILIDYDCWTIIVFMSLWNIGTVDYVCWSANWDVLFVLRCIWLRIIRLGWLSDLVCSCGDSVGENWSTCVLYYFSLSYWIVCWVSCCLVFTPCFYTCVGNELGSTWLLSLLFYIQVLVWRLVR